MSEVLNGNALKDKFEDEIVESKVKPLEEDMDKAYGTAKTQHCCLRSK